MKLAKPLLLVFFINVSMLVLNKKPYYLQKWIYDQKLENNSVKAFQHSFPFFIWRCGLWLVFLTLRLNIYAYSGEQENLCHTVPTVAIEIVHHVKYSIVQGSVKINHFRCYQLYL